MNLTSRSYSGKLFRPKPEILQSSDKIIISTPWGERNSARKAIESIDDFLSQIVVDDDLTIPFSDVTPLKSEESRLYNALAITHKEIFEQDNADEYHSGLELMALQLEGYKLSWAQVGSPNLFLARPGCSMIPLSYQTDLSLETCENNKLCPPLPNSLLGLGSLSKIYTHSFTLKPSDKLILTSASYLPKSFFQMNFDQINLESLSRTLSSFDPESPFWLGTIEL